MSDLIERLRSRRRGGQDGTCLLAATEIERLREVIQRAVPAMQAYARANPVHHFGETPQDPNGVHAWLAGMGSN